ncbi:MAG: hypothetical protein IJG40_05305 [Oscillospiraceae bacterium]|nr:hypothetical protein [Oscillospiraceae bacterium]
MAVTAMDIFERAMHLSDNGDESTGKFDTVDNREYKYRTPSIINTFINEVYPYSDTCKTVPGKRPAHPFITSMDDEIDLDNYCVEVLAHGLAAKLFTDENGTIANYYQQEYERRLNDLRIRGGIPSAAEPIEDAYSGAGYYDEETGEWVHLTGIYPHNQFGRWA